MTDSKKKRHVSELKEKISSAQKHFRSVKKIAYFGGIFDEAFEQCGLQTKHPKLLELLACHPSEWVRRAVTINPNASYQTLLFLLKDKAVAVRRAVMVLGKFEQSDYVALSESFLEKKIRRQYHHFDSEGYLQLIKSSASWPRWYDSQSALILYNPHIGEDALRSMDIGSFFAPWEDKLAQVESFRNERITQVKGKHKGFDLSSVKSLADMHLILKYQIPNYVRFALPLNRLTKRNFNKAEKFLLEQLNQQSKENASKKKIVSIGESKLHDRERASSPDVSLHELKLLLDSRDEETRKLALANPKATIRDLKTGFHFFPLYVHSLPKFREHIDAHPKFVKELYEPSILKLLRRIPNCHPAFPQAICDSFEHRIKALDRAVSPILLKWNARLQLLISHPSTSSATLVQLYKILYSDSPRISEKRKQLIRSIEKHPKFKGR